MTEDEAKTKDCCGPPAEAWARIALHQVGSGWGEFVRDRPRCVASACMAWRPRDQQIRHDERSVSVIKGGFCGLAGSPQ